jgi:hypothetical protein
MKFICRYGHFVFCPTQFYLGNLAIGLKWGTNDDRRLQGYVGILDAKFFIMGKQMSVLVVTQATHMLL